MRDSAEPYNELNHVRLLHLGVNINMTDMNFPPSNPLMTEQERTGYRTRMRAAETIEAREQIRKEHHEQVKVRAKARGENLPGEPPARGGGMGSGGGMKQGRGR